MTAKRQREIVVEFERVEMIRKRAKTHLEYCPKCGSEKDLVEIETAAELFDIEIDQMVRFVNSSGVHYIGKTQVCVLSLLTAMDAKHNYGLRLINEKSQTQNF